MSPAITELDPRPGISTARHQHTLAGASGAHLLLNLIHHSRCIVDDAPPEAAANVPHARCVKYSLTARNSIWPEASARGYTLHYRAVRVARHAEHTLPLDLASRQVHLDVDATALGDPTLQAIDSLLLLLHLQDAACIDFPNQQPRSLISLVASHRRGPAKVASARQTSEAQPATSDRPSTTRHLRDVANALLKARKVVVVTGAGISTNSGIPDFRSENGLYSLIQAQFDAAARQARLAEAAAADVADYGDGDAFDEGRPTKRRKISRESSAENVEIDQGRVKDEEKPEAIGDSITVHVDLPTAGPDEESPLGPTDEKLELPVYSTPRIGPITTGLAPFTTSPLSSPPAEDFILPPSTLRHTRRRLIDVAMPLSSSPLSSPPPVLFDPFIPSSPSNASSGRRSSTSPSEVDDGIPSSNPFSCSQASNSSRSTLPNMKGKDLFDANIWSDPIRTSVFYTFATSLRQKIKEAEPTDSHRFISHLRDRGKLVRCYTQNIDQIEEKVGLSTCLEHGPGSKGRFSRRSTANTNQLNKMVEEASAVTSESSGTESSSQSQSQPELEPVQQSQEAPSDENSTPATDGETPPTDQGKLQPQPQKPRSGVECVFLHGSLELLRCFLCGKVCSWDDEQRETQTLAGQQPECPHCVGATVAREERGKRRLGVGKLRPDIVLYGEDNPNTQHIHPIVTHDLSLCPDMLLILGTSLRVHGLKVMVREFAKAVHSKGGNVVFVNFTKPPESSWGDVIDYWVQWDCDAWVADLQNRIPKLWQEPEPPRPKKKRESTDGKEEKKKPPPANPVALRDTKVTGAYWTCKVLQELHRITGTAPPARRASISAPLATNQGSIEVAASTLEKAMKPKARKPRKSAPGALEKPKRTSSTLNPNHGRSKKPVTDAARSIVVSPTVLAESKASISSILNSVKENPRIRKRKRIDGVEVPAPFVGRRRTPTPAIKATAPELKLAPMASPPMQASKSRYGRPEPMEPKSPPSGPLTTLSPNRRVAAACQRASELYNPDPWVHLLDSRPQWSESWTGAEDKMPLRFGHKDGATAVPGLAESPTLLRPSPIGHQQYGDLQRWGSSWR
ncbi:Sir2 family protein [Purpureocillium lavendulum]|uniref:Sir2 family protein n=1 Tax=Purpureocillium lavendulum TaxID=1247861 RepID=A0AB34FM26_9HYPO|nr:Sir2 family protein [Purpureocillium lavendulum]